MIFKSIIKSDLEEHFYISELSDDKNQVANINYMDISHDYTLDDIENHKKGIIRGVRLSKIMGKEDSIDNVDSIIDIIMKIKDPKILPRYINSDYQNFSPTLRTFQIFLTEKMKFEISPSGFDHTKSLYTNIYNQINSTLEELLVNKYLELSYINNVKNKYFFGTESIVCDNDPTLILSKINLGLNKILKSNRKELGNMIIINPSLYNRYKSYFLKLNIQVFISIYIPENKIICTLNSKGIEFFRLIYSLKESDIVDDGFKTYKRIRLDYGYNETSISPEDNCVLIDIKL